MSPGEIGCNTIVSSTLKACDLKTIGKKNIQEHLISNTAWSPLPLSLSTFCLHSSGNISPSH